VRPARWKLVSLWLSQIARVAADNALRFFLVLLLYFGAYRATAWYLVTALLMGPAVLLAPFNGALTNSLPKPAVLIGSAAYAFVVTALGVALFDAAADTGWLISWALLSLGAAVYGPTRYALLPAAADDTRWPLSRLNGAFEMGAAVAVIVGLIAALRLHGESWAGHPAAAVVSAGLGGAALLFALPVRFASDVQRPEPALQAVRSFFADARTIWSRPEPRVCLVGLALLRGVITGLTGALLPGVVTGAEPDFEQIAIVAAWVGWVMAGFAAGAFVAGLHWHPRRVLGVVVWGAAGLTIGLACAAAGAVPGPVLLVTLGAMSGLVMVPLAATYQAELSADARGNGMAVRNFADYLCVAVTSLVLLVLAGPIGASPAVQLGLLAAACGVATAYALWFFRRPTVELLVEGLFLLLYRFRAAEEP
jgi:hypothetical protein